MTTSFKPVIPSWINADGLLVYFGPAEGKSGDGGEYRTHGADRQQEFLIDLTSLTTTAAYLDQHFELPKGAFIENVEIETLVACTSGGSATLNVGLKQSDQSTNISDTALVSALAVASIAAAGTKVILTTGSTGAGSSIGTGLSVNGLYTLKAGTAVFTAGRLAVRVNYSFLPLV